MIKITCIRGVISSEADGIEIDDSLAEGNSSNWIFDVEHPAESTAFSVTLLEFRGRKPKLASRLSPQLTPLNLAAAKALIYFPEPDAPRISVNVVNGNGSPLKYRISIDVAHSLSR